MWGRQRRDRMAITAQAERAARELLAQAEEERRVAAQKSFDTWCAERDARYAAIIGIPDLTFEVYFDDCLDHHDTENIADTVVSCSETHSYRKDGHIVISNRPLSPEQVSAVLHQYELEMEDEIEEETDLCG
jgi:hypothetical protein